MLYFTEICIAEVTVIVLWEFYRRICADWGVVMKKCLLIFLVLFIAKSASAEFTISALPYCTSESRTYAYKIGRYILNPDIEIKVGKYVSSPDVKIKIVSDSRQANLIFVDDRRLGYLANQVDMKVCKKNLLAGRHIKSVKIGRYVLYPDIKVKIGEFLSNPDYTLYFDSNEFTLEEAAGLIPAIWELRKKY